MCEELAPAHVVEDEVELGGGLEGVVHGHEEGRLADRLQHLALCPCVLGGLLLLHNVCFLQHLHSVTVNIMLLLGTSVSMSVFFSKTIFFNILTFIA